MNPDNQENQIRILLRPVNSENWSDVARLQVTQSLREFVAEPSYYLAMCCYGNDWQPLAIYLDEQVIGFMMWAVDPAENSCWFGGIMINQSYQRKDYGRQALQGAISMFAKEYGLKKFCAFLSTEKCDRQTSLHLSGLFGNG